VGVYSKRYVKELEEQARQEDSKQRQQVEADLDRPAPVQQQEQLQPKGDDDGRDLKRQRAPPDR
jgi:hypothetical protein